MSSNNRGTYSSYNFLTVHLNLYFSAINLFFDSHLPYETTTMIWEHGTPLKLLISLATYIQTPKTPRVVLHVLNIISLIFFLSGFVILPANSPMLGATGYLHFS